MRGFDTNQFYRVVKGVSTKPMDKQIYFSQKQIEAGKSRFVNVPDNLKYSEAALSPNVD